MKALGSTAGVSAPSIIGAFSITPWASVAAGSAVAGASMMTPSVVDEEVVSV